MKNWQFATDLAPPPKQTRIQMCNDWRSLGHSIKKNGVVNFPPAIALLFLPDQGSTERGRFLVSPVSQVLITAHFNAEHCFELDCCSSPFVMPHSCSCELLPLVYWIIFVFKLQCGHDSCSCPTRKVLVITL